MKTPAVVIRYRYPGTVNGTPVGEVYVLELDDHPELAGLRGFSYTKRASLASEYTVPEAEELIVGKHWPEVALIPAETAMAVLP